MSDEMRISYAQNFEDLILDRVFRDRRTGFYVDVGAGDPVKYSVTQKFYLRGWRGINIDAAPAQYEALSKARLADVNLHLAIGDSECEIPFYVCELNELSTLDPDVAEGLRRAGHTVVETAIPMRTLAQICREHCGARQIDFMKIDAEGSEQRILAGADFDQFRPRVLVVEAVAPNTTVSSHDAWEPILLAKNYLFAWFDGLNRFYVREEDRALLRHFQTPIGLYDGFSPYELFKSADVRADASMRSTERQALQTRIAELEARTKQLQDQLAAEREMAQWRGQTWLSRKLKSRLGFLRLYPPRTMAVSPPVPRSTDDEPRPTMAIVTPCLNSVAFLEATIRSVLAQDYPALEYVIQDGHSSDGSAELARRFAGGAVRVEFEHDTGQADAINRGFAKTSGDIMAWLNADDILLPGCLDYVARYFQRHPAIDLVYGHRIIVDTDGFEVARWIVPPHMPRAVALADYIPQETLFWRRRVWQRVGPLNDSFDFAFDWDFILRAQDAGFRFKRLPRFLGAFRVHEAQKTNVMAETGAAEMARIRRARFGRDVDYKEINKGLRWYRAVHVLLHRAYMLKILKY